MITHPTAPPTTVPNPPPPAGRMAGRTGPWSKGRLAALALFPLLAIVLLQVVIVVKIHNRDRLLAERGVTTTAVVIGTDYHGDTDYLRVRLTDCGCVVEVATSNVDGHPVGSTLPVRYDPVQPGRARALVDRPYPYENELGVAGGLALGVLIVVPLLWAARRRRRRALRLVASTAPTMAVRVEAWERTINNNPVYYLSVYPARVGIGTQPLLCMPVAAKTLAQIPPDATLDLFGPPEPGKVVALRTGDVVITPAGRTRPPAFETAKRKVHATIALTGLAGDGGDPAPVPALDGPLLRDAREARLWRRTNRIFGWLLPMMIILPAVRVLPDPLLWWGLAAIFAALGVEVVLLWGRRRLLDRLAERLPGPPATGRNDRRAARRAAAAYLTGTRGTAEQANLLGTTADALAAERQRAGRRVIAAVVLTSAAFLAMVVYIATA